MEVVYACWVFDQRWACKLPNPCSYFALLVPSTLNATTIALILIERSPYALPHRSIFLALVSVIALQTLLGVFIMIRIAVSTKLSHPN